MKRLFCLMLIVVLGAIFAGCYAPKTYAQNATYTPLQPAHAGLWADLTANGQGIELVPFDVSGGGREVFAVLFTADKGYIDYTVSPIGVGRFDPVWYAGSSSVTRNGAVLPLHLTATISGLRNYAGPLTAPVATLTLSNIQCDTMDATVVWDANSSGYNDWTVPLPPVSYRLTRLNPGERQCYTCPSVAFSPPAPGCGF